MSENDEHSKAPKKIRNIWHMFIMYPTLIVALIGAVPQYIEQWKAYKLAIPKENLNQENKQRAMWDINFDCTREVFPHVVVTEKKIHIEVTTCPTGDILIITRKPGESNPTTQWIATNEK